MRIAELFTNRLPITGIYARLCDVVVPFYAAYSVHRTLDLLLDYLLCEVLLAIRSLKAKIAYNVAILILLSALATHILVILVVQKILIQREIDLYRQNADITARSFLGDPKDALHDKTSAQKSMLPFWIADSNTGEHRALWISDRVGHIIFKTSGGHYDSELFKSVTVNTIRHMMETRQNFDFSWVGFWWQPHRILISSPIMNGPELLGAATFIVPLQPIYSRLQNFTKPVLLYILINTSVLTAAGLYRIFKLYLRPIDRVIKQADDFKEDDDPFFIFRREDDELNRLSTALNKMLKRIDQDRQTLKKNVESLENANRELKIAQSEVILAEKMATIGRLSAGIAHEIGNPLAIVLGYLDLLKQKDSTQTDRDDFLSRTEKEIQRINTIIRQLLDLTRHSRTLDESINVHVIVQDIMNVMRVQPLMKHVTVKLDLIAACDRVRGNPEQLRQVFLNILLNAADALKEQGCEKDGVVEISTSNKPSMTSPENKYLVISFNDNGPGMDDEQLKSVFDPFFTTKEPGKGTGLGLAVSYMLIQQMGGHIYAKAQKAQGMTIIIHLPLLEVDRQGAEHDA